MNKMLLAVMLLHCSVSFAADKADYVIVNKSERKTMLFATGKLLKSYRISLGGNPVGHKVQEGDQKTPEGRYVLDYKKSDSAYYKAIRVSYPNAQDKQNAARLNVSPGGQIMIHGQANGFAWLGGVLKYFDWTAGCIAVTNTEMEDIWTLVDAGTPIEINP